MLKKALLLLVLLLLVGAASGASIFNITTSADFFDGTHSDTYPSAGSLRLGMVNEMFTEDTDAPNPAG